VYFDMGEAMLPMPGIITRMVLLGKVYLCQGGSMSFPLMEIEGFDQTGHRLWIALRIIKLFFTLVSTASSISLHWWWS